MKRFAPYILFLLFFSCNNQKPPTGAVTTPAPDKMVQLFIHYLKNNDTKGALNMVDCWDSTAEFEVNEAFINRELSAIDSAEKAIKIYGINDTTWHSQIDTLPNTNRTFIDKSVSLNVDPTDSLSDYFIVFLFDTSKSDVVMRTFIFGSRYTQH